jgi:hypothetical protein
VLAGLVDDAALFPPSSAPIDAAVVDHRRFRASRYATLVGRFLCPSSSVSRLRQALDAEPGLGASGDRGRRTAPARASTVEPGLARLSGPAPADRPVHSGPIRVGVIVDVGLDALPRTLADVAADPRLVLEAVEIPLPPGISGRHALTDATKRAVAALPTGLLGYVEVPRVDGWEAALDVLSALGRGAKLRTGGTAPAAFPSVAEVAGFFTACAARLLPLKCTAGLHHAVRRPDAATGVQQHGFLNLLVAAGAAVAGEDPAGPLSEEDGVALAKQVQAMDAGPARGLLTSFGSCSVAEPVAELRELGLLP